MGLLIYHEDALEGSFLRVGWDLADLYRDRLTIRQLWVRFTALPPEAPIWASIEVEAERAAETAKAQSIDDALAMFKREQPVAD